MSDKEQLEKLDKSFPGTTERTSNTVLHRNVGTFQLLTACVLF